MGSRLPYYWQRDCKSAKKPLVFRTGGQSCNNYATPASNWTARLLSGTQAGREKVCGATGCPGVLLKHTGIVCLIAWCTWNILAWECNLFFFFCEKKTCLTRRFHDWDDQRLCWPLAVTMLRPLKACRPLVGAQSNHRPDTWVVGIRQPYPWHTHGSVVVQHLQVNDKLTLHESIAYNWLKGILTTCTHAPSALRRTSALGCVCRTDCRTPGGRVQLRVHSLASWKPWLQPL